MKITIFSEELRRCLNAAGLPDYTWNYWYQRLMNAYNESVERQIMTEQTENAKLRELVERLQPKDCEGNVLDIADTVHMLRSEYDGDHEWDDMVVELALTKWGGDRWIVRGSKGEAWACDCTKTGYDEDAFEDSGDVEPFDNATLAEVENAKLRMLAIQLRKTLSESEGEADTCGHCELLDECVARNWHECEFDRRMRELGMEVD